MFKIIFLISFILFPVIGCVEDIRLIQPPKEFDYKFNGQIIIHKWNIKDRPFKLWAKSERNYFLDGWNDKNICNIFIAEELFNTEWFYKLYKIEQANCNGWALRDGDVNFKIGF